MADVTTCAETEELIALAALGVLEPSTAAPMERHMTGCAACRETARAYQRAVAVLPEALEPLRPSRELRRRIMGEVYASGGRRRAPRLRAAALWQRVPQARAFTAVAVCAAAAAIALAVWGVSRGGPAAQSFAVVPTTVAAGAHGELTYYAQSARSVLTVTGIPAPRGAAPTADVYEVWLVPQNGAPVGAGFLAPVPDSGGTWTAAINGNVVAYQLVAATIEPPGGSTHPTGMQLFSVPLSQ